jgi:hypothetical protein
MTLALGVTGDLCAFGIGAPATDDTGIGAVMVALAFCCAGRFLTVVIDTQAAQITIIFTYMLVLLLYAARQQYE